MTKKILMTAVFISMIFCVSVSSAAISDEDFIKLCRRGSAEEIEEALKAGANVHARAKYGNTALMLAASVRSPEVTTALINAGADVNATNQNGVTALIFAAAGSGFPEVVPILINAGANVYVRDQHGVTPLMFAAQNNGEMYSEAENITALINAGVDVNATNPIGTTALMYAASGGTPKAIITLINAGADVNATNQNGITALMFAAKDNRNQKATTALIGAGADVNAANRNGTTALMYAAGYGIPEAVSALINAGANVNATMKNGITVLRFAVEEFGAPGGITALIEAGADVNARTQDGTTVLMSAVVKHSPEVVTALVEAGADVNAKSKDGTTALMRAASRVHNLEVRKDLITEVITALIEAGADVKAKNARGQTALDIARQNKSIINTKPLEILSLEDITEANLSQIPSNAVTFRGHSYALYDNGCAREDAEKFCESLGGHMATITSQEENDFLYAYVLSIGHQNVYFGLTDRETEGVWKWVNGETSDYRNWALGEPNQQSSRENYAMFYLGYPDGTWNDGEFGGRTVYSDTVFLCEWDYEALHTSTQPADLS